MATRRSINVSGLAPQRPKKFLGAVLGVAQLGMSIYGAIKQNSDQKKAVAKQNADIARQNSIQFGQRLDTETASARNYGSDVPLESFYAKGGRLPSTVKPITQDLSVAYGATHNEQNPQGDGTGVPYNNVELEGGGAQGNRPGEVVKHEQDGNDFVFSDRIHFSGNTTFAQVAQQLASKKAVIEQEAGAILKTNDALKDNIAVSGSVIQASGDKRRMGRNVIKLSKLEEAKAAIDSKVEELKNLQLQKGINMGLYNPDGTPKDNQEVPADGQMAAPKMAKGGYSNWDLGGAQTDKYILNKLKTEMPERLDIQDRTFKYFRKNTKWDDETIKAVMANISRESLFDPKIDGDSGQSEGLFQWRNNSEVKRKDDFKKIIGVDIKDSTAEQQLDYFMHEITKGNFKNVGENLQDITDGYYPNASGDKVADVAKVLVNDYEFTDNREASIKNNKDRYNLFSKEWDKLASKYPSELTYNKYATSEKMMQSSKLKPFDKSLPVTIRDTPLAKNAPISDFTPEEEVQQDGLYGNPIRQEIGVDGKPLVGVNTGSRPTMKRPDLNPITLNPTSPMAYIDPIEEVDDTEKVVNGKSVEANNIVLSKNINTGKAAEPFNPTAAIQNRFNPTDAPIETSSTMFANPKDNYVPISAKVENPIVEVKTPTAKTETPTAKTELPATKPIEKTVGNPLGVDMSIPDSLRNVSTGKVIDTNDFSKWKKFGNDADAFMTSPVGYGVMGLANTVTNFISNRNTAKNMAELKTPDYIPVKALDTSRVNMSADRTAIRENAKDVGRFAEDNFANPQVALAVKQNAMRQAIAQEAKVNEQENTTNTLIENQNIQRRLGVDVQNNAGYMNVEGARFQKAMQDINNNQATNAALTKDLQDTMKGVQEGVREEKVLKLYERLYAPGIAERTDLATEGLKLEGLDGQETFNKLREHGYTEEQAMDYLNRKKIGNQKYVAGRTPIATVGKNYTTDKTVKGYTTTKR